MKFKTRVGLFLLILFAVQIMSCERPVPKDVMFCKSWEVFVLENPFDKESAKIVIYRGDEVKLMGDTVYHVQIDSTKKDSADFNVKVTAKRGVIGWVHIKDLQKERISNLPKTRKKQNTPVPAKNDEKVKVDSTAVKTDSISSSDKNTKSDSLTTTQNN